MNVFCRNMSKFAPKFVIERSMKRIFQVFCGLLVAALSLISCLNSSDDSTTYYSDMAIKTFTLGTLNRYLHTTTSDGRDSIYKSTYTASSYKLNIDQLNHKIYSADSLLPNTDVSRVVCSVTTSNNGVVYVKSMTSDTLTYFISGSDSIDFTQPRIFRVFANDGSGSRDYTVSLAVRSQEKDVFFWTEADEADFPQDSNAWMQVIGKDGLNYIGSTRFEAYALGLSPDDLKKSVDGAQTWANEQLETDGSLLPRWPWAFVSWELSAYTDYALFVGYNSQVSDKAMTIWRKLVDSDCDGRWVYMPLDEDNPYYLPKMDKVSLVYFNKCVLAFCSDKNIYVSRDQGITWKKTSTYSFPVGCSSAFRVATDDDDNVWLTDTVSGKTWRGRLTK